jgi:hypothetical protein
MHPRKQTREYIKVIRFVLQASAGKQGVEPGTLSFPAGFGQYRTQWAGGVG